MYYLLVSWLMKITAIKFISLLLTLRNINYQVLCYNRFTITIAENNGSRFYKLITCTGDIIIFLLHFVGTCMMNTLGKFFFDIQASASASSANSPFT